MKYIFSHEEIDVDKGKFVMNKIRFGKKILPLYNLLND